MMPTGEWGSWRVTFPFSHLPQAGKECCVLGGLHLGLPQLQVAETSLLDLQCSQHASPTRLQLLPSYLVPFQLLPEPESLPLPLACSPPTPT